MYEELKHITNESSLHFVYVHYKITTYTKYPHYRLKKEGGNNTRPNNGGYTMMISTDNYFQYRHIFMTT
jgi:hypothetical protein